jgi:MOSC domain-containing protein YiiM
MNPSVLSVNGGSREPNGAKAVGVTGIHKRPVELVEVRAPGPKRGGLGSGGVGDFLGDTRHHGGDTQAVYAFAREELDWWAGELGRELPDGTFGENLTTRAVEVDGAVVGERWAVGNEVVLEVCGPRIPCATFAARMQVRGWVKRFAARGNTGAYLSVVRQGTIRRGDEVVILERPDHGITVGVTFRAFMGDLDAARHVLDADCLVATEAAELRAMVEKRAPAGVELDA